MDRLACVNCAAFPLQLLLKRHPEWSAYPAAVIAEDKPQAMILWVNEKARRAGVRSELRFAAAGERGRQSGAEEKILGQHTASI